MAFRFIHTADWQIGKPFKNFEGDTGGALRTQRITTIKNIAQYAAQNNVDAVLVAGDAFDSNTVDDKTIHRTFDAMTPFSGPWIFLPGNHDAALAHSVWTRIRKNFSRDNIIIADTPAPIFLKNDTVCVLPAPLTRKREPADQTAWFDSYETPDHTIRIGLAHGSVADRLPAAAESANDIAETRAQTANLDYLALGDWHGMLAIAPKTYYSGAPETDRFRENTSGHMLDVTIAAASESPHVKSVPIGHFTWLKHHITLLSGTQTAFLAELDNLIAQTTSTLLELSLSGTLTLAERHELNQELTAWETQLHYLFLDDTALFYEPSEDDLDALDTSGFVRVALERLKEQLSSPDPEQAGAARLALSMIYQDHMQEA